MRSTTSSASAASGGDVERVRARARRVRRVVVERVEVVVDELDLGALDDPEPRPTKTSSISRRVAVSRCRRPTGARRVAGQRDVDAVARPGARVELAGLELGARAPSSSASSAWRAWLAALPTGAALARAAARRSPRRRFGSSALRPR